VLALSRVRRDHSSKNRRATLTQTDRCASPCSASTSNRRPCPLFTSSGQVNSWLSFKRLSQALPGKAGGAAVTTMVDHTSMRGSRPHDLCASRSCLGLSTSIGSAIRHIVDARVPLTTTQRVLHWQLPVIGSLMNPNPVSEGLAYGEFCAMLVTYRRNVPTSVRTGRLASSLRWASGRYFSSAGVTRITVSRSILA
jgi:hypothetical protein